MVLIELKSFITCFLWGVIINTTSFSMATDIDLLFRETRIVSVFFKKEQLLIDFFQLGLWMDVSSLLARTHILLFRSAFKYDTHSFNNHSIQTRQPLKLIKTFDFHLCNSNQFINLVFYIISSHVQSFSRSANSFLNVRGLPGLRTDSLVSENFPVCEHV